MNKKTRYKKLFRKLRAAHRAGEAYDHMIAQLDTLDVQIAREDAGWRIGGHNKYKKRQTAQGGTHGNAG